MTIEAKLDALTAAVTALTAALTPYAGAGGKALNALVDRLTPIPAPVLTTAQHEAQQQAKAADEPTPATPAAPVDPRIKARDLMRTLVLQPGGPEKAEAILKSCGGATKLSNLADEHLAAFSAACAKALA